VTFVEVAAVSGSKCVVFFDVDHTLITGSSMAGFFTQLKQMHDSRELIAAVTALLEQRAAHQDHGQLITAAMRTLKGETWDSVLEIGQAWYDQHGRSQFVTASGERLRQHQERGDLVVLVSGSWLPALAPIARALGVEHILCCSPEIVDGVLTGVLPYPVIGEGKVRAINEFVADNQVDLGQAVAYGEIRPISPCSRWLPTRWQWAQTRFS
jgi:putative phosphoserine phosphatase/1-acylglycerol-3-phosphate O-acyltransferase